MAFEAYDPDLPDELQGRSTREPGQDHLSPERSPEDREQRLEELSTVISRLRDESVKARRESGIEDVWAACEDAYQCIDDSNRPENRPKWNKPTSMVGPLTRASSKKADDDHRSTAFVRLTARYVDMGVSRICEIVLPIDDKAFSLGPTPVPDLINRKDDPTPVHGPGGQLLMKAAEQPSQPGQVPQKVPVTVGDIAKAEMDKAAAAADKAEQRIYDWMVESRYPMQMRKVMHDSGRIGVGVLKAPFPETRESKSFSIDGGVAKFTASVQVKPSYKWISPWNLFPHKACGEDIHSGDYIFERDFVAEAALRKLKQERDPITGKSYYIADQIDKVIKEGPDKCRTEGGTNPAERVNDSQYEIWYMHGMLKRQDFLDFEPAIGDDDLPDELQHVYCIITLVNDTVIRVTVNPLESGKFPYRTMPWSRRSGHWSGIGIAEQVSLAQTIVNAGTRRLLDNAGISSGAQIVVDQGAVDPADGSWRIVPDKVWLKNQDATVDDVRKVFMAVEFPNLTPQLMDIINYGFKLAEEASNIPLISQGQTGPQDPQTFGQSELQNNNANSLLRNLGYSVDDHITEPVVRDSYEWLLMDPNVPEDEKGDFEINARGSIAMVEKAIQEQTLALMLGWALNPAYEMNPAKVAEEFMRAKRMDPRRAKYTEEELQKIRSAPPPEAPQITVAKIRAQVDMQRAKMDMDRDTAYNQSLERRDATMANYRRQELVIKREIAYLEAQIRMGINVEQNKAKLADTVMRLNTQKELSAQALAVDLHKHRTPMAITPPVEPSGRAAPGQAFTQ